MYIITNDNAIKITTISMLTLNFLIPVYIFLKVRKAMKNRSSKTE